MSDVKDTSQPPSFHFVVTGMALTAHEAFRQVERLARLGATDVTWLESTDGKTWKVVDWR